MKLYIVSLEFHYGLGMRGTVRSRVYKRGTLRSAIDKLLLEMKSEPTSSYGLIARANNTNGTITLLKAYYRQDGDSAIIENPKSEVAQ